MMCKSPFCFNLKPKKKRNKSCWRLISWSKSMPMYSMGTWGQSVPTAGFIPKLLGNLLAKEVYNLLIHSFMLQLIIYLLPGLIYSAHSPHTDGFNQCHYFHVASSFSKWTFQKKKKEMGKVKIFRYLLLPYLIPRIT